MNKSVILQDEVYACIDKRTHTEENNKNENAKQNCTKMNIQKTTLKKN